MLAIARIATAHGGYSVFAGVGTGVDAIEDYNVDGAIQVVSYDAELNLIHPMGVVPFPEDYLTSYLFDWVTLTQLDPPVWEAVPTGTDTIQILPEFVRPLDTGQMTDLGMTGP